MFLNLIQGFLDLWIINLLHELLKLLLGLTHLVILFQRQHIVIPNLLILLLQPHPLRKARLCILYIIQVPQAYTPQVEQHTILLDLDCRFEMDLSLEISVVDE